MGNILISYGQVFRKASPYSLYVLFVLLATYMLNQLDRYALNITNIEISQEIKYGDKGCLKQANQSKTIADECAKLNQTE
jgi:hypothetical protein